MRNVIGAVAREIHRNIQHRLLQALEMCIGRKIGGHQ